MIKLSQLALLVCLVFTIGCGGAGNPTGGGFAYGGKYYGTWGGPGGPPHGSDFIILLDEQGDIVVDQSSSGQASKCHISGSVRKTGSTISLTVQVTVGSGNVCTNNILTAEDCQLTYESRTLRWTGVTTGTFSDPHSVRQIGFSLTRYENL